MAILLITVGVPFYGMPFFYDYFIRDFGWSRGQTVSGIAIATILIQPAAGALLDRYSPRKLIIFGSMMLLVALVAFGLGSGSLLLYYASWCAFMVGYVYAGPLPQQVLLTRWFRRRRGLAIGLSYMGLGLGGAISQKYVALPLIQRFGWRVALMTMGASLLLVLPIALFVVRDRPSDKGLFPDGAECEAAESLIPPQPLSRLLRSRAFWLLMLGSCCSIGAIGSINQHMKLLFQDAGLSGAAVADTTFVILVSSLVGRVVLGWLADRFSKKALMIVSYVLVAAPIPLLFVVRAPAVSTIFAVAFGVGLGADFMFIPLMSAQLFGPNSLGRVMGIVLPANSIGQTCFPFLLGLLRDRNGDYRYSLMVATVLGVAGVCLIAMLPGKGLDVAPEGLAPVTCAEGTNA